MDLFGLENSREYAVSWWPKINDLVHAISPIWNTSRAFGTHVIRFDTTKGRPTSLDLVLSLAITFLRIYMMYIIHVTDAWDLIFVSSSQLVEKGLDIVLKIPFYMMLFVPWIFLFRKRKFSHISEDLAIFDALIAKHNYPLNYQFFHIFSTLLTTASISIPLISLASIRGFEFWMDHFIVLTFVGFSWAGGLLYNTICNVMLFHILYRLEAINDFLRKNFCSNRIQDHRENALPLIKTLMRLHDKLSDISTNCSQCFGFSVGTTVFGTLASLVVLTMIHVLVSQLLTTFAFIRVIFYHFNVVELNDCIFYTIGTTSYCCLPIITIWIAGHIKKRTIVTWKLVHRIINTTAAMEAENLFQQFSEQMNHRTPSVDFRFFDVDWPLLVKACSEAATYLIIMIQFETKH
uniref:Gustatory receptor n=1 Tax=Anopheles christyi TaxID=43041 RepID=A0A182JRQ7_9DIPT